MPEGFLPRTPNNPTPPRTPDLLLKTQAPAQRGGDTFTRATHVAVQNPAPLPQLQVGPGFRLRQSMEQAADVTVIPVPQTDNGRPLCFVGIYCQLIPD